MIPYLPLGNDSLITIAGLKLQKLSDRVRTAHGISLLCTERLIQTLVQRCTLLQSGARLIDTVMDRDILPMVSLKILDALAAGQKCNDLVLDADDAGAICCASIQKSEYDLEASL